MIDKPLEKITFTDLEAFVQEQWPEGKTVDYKRDSYGGKDEDKKELLKDVSSFANTHGGDILIGVDEDKGMPIGIPGITIADADREKLRLEEIIRKGLEPRIDCGIHHVTTPSNTCVIVIRVKESLLFPHRVVFQGKSGEFWGRSSAGKFSMDTDELRRAFTLSDSIYQQIRAFRQERVGKIIGDETPIPLMSGGKLVLHLIPVSAFRSRQLFDVASMRELPTQFPPMGIHGWERRLNLDGHVSFGGQQDSSGHLSYTQFFRNGTIEAVLSDIVLQDQVGRVRLRAGFYERVLVHDDYQAVKFLLKGLRDVGIQPPIWCFLTLTGVKDAQISRSDERFSGNVTIDRDVLLLPECVIDDLETDPVVLLRPMFDLIWNAAGLARSPNFDAHGVWAGT